MAWLNGCGSTPREEMLREFYYNSAALGDDSTSFASMAESLRVYDPKDSLVSFLWRFNRASYLATLGKLGYGVGPRGWKYGPGERRALGEFQADVGLRQSQRLDSATISWLVRADKALEITPVTLPSFVFYGNERFISAHGTWKALTNRLGYPVNTVDVECSRETGVCEVVSVGMIDDELRHLGRITRNRYDIQQWDARQLVAVGEDWPDSDCHATLTIHIPTEEVTVHQWCGPREALLGGVMEPSQMTLKLVDGMWLSLQSRNRDLPELHDDLYADRDTFTAIYERNLRRGLERK
jgi:hypothetical protein